jgi:YD repeat-containing protein
VPGANPYNETYAYDPNGNLTSKTGVGAYQYGANLNGTGAGPHQARTVNGQAYSYDANGNLLSGGGRTYTWNDERLPASVASGGVTESYSYDADGERVTRTRSGTTTRYLEGLWEVSGSTTQAYYAFTGQTVAVRNGSAVTSLHGDHLGSVSVTTGASTSSQTFLPWGAIPTNDERRPTNDECCITRDPCPLTPDP